MGDLIDQVNDRLYSDRTQIRPSTTVNLTLSYLNQGGEIVDTVEPDTRLLQGYTHIEDLGVDQLHGSYAFGHKNPDGSRSIRSHGDPRVREHLVELLDKPS